MPTPRKTRTKTPAAPPADVIDANDWRSPVGAPTSTNVLALPGGEFIEEDDPIPLTAADRIAAMLQGIGGDERAVVKLYRIPAPGKMQWCEDYTPEVFERGAESLIRSKWGAGEYMIRLYGTTAGKSGSAGYGVRAADTISIAADASSPNPIAAMPAGIAQAIEAMAANQRQMLETLSARPGAADPMAQMRDMLSLMTMMRTAMGIEGGGAASKPHGLAETLKELKMLRELAPELLGEKGGDDEDKDPLTTILKPMLQIISNQQAGAAQQPAQLGHMPPVSLPGSMGADDHMPPIEPPPTVIHPNPTGAQDMPLIEDPQTLVAELRKKLGAVIAMAAADLDPEGGADIIFEHLPDDMLAMLDSPAWFEALCQFEPGAAPYRTWLDEARAIVLDWMAQEKAEAAANDAAGGSATPGAATS